MRKNFYDILDEMDFDPEDEFQRLYSLFTSEYIFYNVTLYRFVDQYHFRKLPFRGTFTSLAQLMDAVLPYGYCHCDDLYLLCELLVGILSFNAIAEDTHVTSIRNTIVENIAKIMEKSNHELKQIPGEKFDKYIVVEKRKDTTLAVEIVGDGTIAYDLIEYNHYALKGDLAAKKKLLTSIGAYIEPILNSKVLSQAGYKKLESDAGFILNNFNIRHNNMEGTKQQDYTSSLNPDQLEAWYDKAYDTAIAVIIMKDHLSVEAELTQLKKDYQWKG